MVIVQSSLFSKTYQACSVPSEAEILQWFSGNFANSGRWTSAGEFWTRNTSESHSAADASSLSQILEADAPAKYSLSPKAAAGILRRAEKRGKQLPEHLQAALAMVATTGNQ